MTPWRMALILIVMIEGMIAWSAPTAARRFTGTHDAVWVANEQILAGAPDVDVLFVGDSTMRVALSVPTFAEHTGRKCLNLGLTSALGPYGDLAMLERYLEKHAPPRMLVAGHSLAGWTSPIDLAAFAFTRPSPGRLLQELRARDTGGAGLLHEPWILLGQLLRVATIQVPSNRHRDWLKRAIVPRLEPPPGPDAGWPTRDRDRAAIRAALEAIPRPYRISSEAEAWVRELARVATAAGISMYLVPVPIHVAALEDPLGRELVTAAGEELARLAREVDGVQLLGSSPLPISWEEGSGDLDHVGAAGVDPMTRRLADLVVPVLEEPR